MFDLSRIASQVGGHVDFHELLGSTSDRALELASRADLPLPLLVLTERQTGGRGRGTNRWWAGAGALTFSLALQSSAANLAPDRWPQLALVTGLAVCEVLAKIAPGGDWRVKWPNDVFLNGGKICGILCESVPGWRDRLVSGIGINVNNSLAGAPTEIQQSARALVDLNGLPLDLTDVLLALLDRLDQRWSQLAAESFAALAPAYRERCFLTGKTLTVESGRRTLIGRCLGVNDTGALLLATEAGQIALISGTIRSWE